MKLLRTLSMFAATAVLLTSCATIHKNKSIDKQTKQVKSLVKKDSTATTKVDSTSTTRTTQVTRIHRETTTDTTVQVGADSSTGVTAIPLPGATTTLQDGDITTVLGVDSSGKLTIKTKVRAKAVPVYSRTLEDLTDSVNADNARTASTASTVAVKQSAAVDSTTHTKQALKSKQVTRMSTGVVVGCCLLLLLLLAYICYRGYKKFILK